MGIFNLEKDGFPKTLLMLVVTLLVSTGLCGLQWMYAMGPSGGSAMGILIPVGVIELVVMVGSATGIVVLSILWCVQTLYGRKHQKDEVERLFGNTDETKRDDER
jgi:hypothetical protein